MTGAYGSCKRALDVTLAAALLLVTSPVQAVVAVLVGRDLGRPVLFLQQRTGRFGQPFTLYKFRTMHGGEGVDSDAERLTSLGRLLRRVSLDELPTLWNVVRGDMSLVGPRPLLPAYLERYTARQRARHDVRPGVTGWSQVNGRNAVSWSERLEADLWYVQERSMLLDLRILLRTIGTVVGARRTSAQGHATMPEFFGAPDGVPISAS